jgi:hypothetical protein
MCAGFEEWRVIYPRYLRMALALWCCVVGDAWADEPLKVICAARAVRPPVIDGLLDDPCWKEAEVRSDFTSPSSGEPVKRLTTMRALYDDSHLYLGLECFWDDVETLKKGVAQIIATHCGGRAPEPGDRCEAKNYDNRFGVELFIDPGATEVNYDQVLINAAGQYTGNYKMLWKEFKGGHRFQSTVRGNCWTLELACPFQGIRAGDSWGLNVCRNDETHYALWKPVDGAYHEPRMFGRIVMGSYAQWWAACGGIAPSRRLSALDDDVGRYERGRPQLRALLEVAAHSARRLERVAADHPPVSRDNFEILYRAHGEFKKDYSRLATALETLGLMSRAAATTRPQAGQEVHP